MSTEYGKRLRAARHYAGLTQVQLSKQTNVPQSTISSAERLANGSAETAIYAQACGVNVMWLATGHGDMLGATHITAEATGNNNTLVTGQGNTLVNNAAPLSAKDHAGVYQVAHGQLRNVERILASLHPTVAQSGRDVLVRWAKGELDTDSAGNTLDALAHVSQSLSKQMAPLSAPNSNKAAA